jgi:hypothetical protein
VTRATGTEPFSQGGRPLGFNLLSFWQWSSSDLVVNIVRGLLAEYLVAEALGLADSVRDPWRPYDLRTPRGLTLEIKSCAYLQSWFQKKHSDLGFSIAETTAWSADTNAFVGERRRQAHVYVFAVLKHRDKPTLNPLEVDQWEFNLVPTQRIAERCGNRKCLSMKALLDLEPVRATYGQLGSAIANLEHQLLASGAAVDEDHP